jgi:hypothetical protein
MRSLVAAEASRFPDVAADYVRRSWERNQALLSGALEQLAARNLLRVDRADVAAEQLTWLLLGGPLNRLTLQSARAPLPSGELGRTTDEAIATFLSRFGAGGS